MYRSKLLNDVKIPLLILKILFICCYALFIIIIVDFFCFFVLDIKAPGYNSSRFFQFNSMLGHFHKPNSKGYWYRYDNGIKFYVTINNFGFSDLPRKVEKERPRIAFIGDSITEFWETNEQDRGQYVMEKLLGKKFEVLNFGVRGYGTDQSYLLLKNVGIYFSPDIIVYLFCINDINDNAISHHSGPAGFHKPYFVLDQQLPSGLRLKGYPIPENKKSYSFLKESILWINDHSFFYRRVWDSLAKKILGRRIIYSVNDNFELRPYKVQYDKDDDNRMEVTTKIVGLLNTFAKTHGKKFIIVEGIYSPVLDNKYKEKLIAQYGDIFDFDKVTKILKDYCQKNNIEFLSLPEQIRAKGIGVTDLLPREDTMHLNKQGILFYIKELIDKLDKLGWLALE